MCAAMLMTILQDKTPGLENAVDDTAEGAGQEIVRVQDFFTNSDFSCMSPKPSILQSML